MNRESRASKLFAYIVMAIVAVIVIVPVIWGTTLAFRSNDEILQMRGLNIHTFVPMQFTWQNFVNIATKINLVQVFRNTLLVAIMVTVGSVMFNTMAGYAFARLSFPGKRVLFAVVLSTLMLPLEILIIPLYSIVLSFGLKDSFAGIILPFVAGGFGVFFMRQFYQGIPRALDESAYLDGCGYFRTFFYILFPLSRGPLITLSLIAFLSQWDSFMVPVTLLHGKDKMLLQVALSYLSFEEFLVDVGAIFAGVLISSAPIIIIFIFLQKYYVAGITTTGIKQ